MSDSAPPCQLLSFYVAGGEYALEILQVREIVPPGEITPLPRVPDFVCGLLNLRGSVVPVVDLARRLGLEPTPRTARSCIVVTELDLDGDPTRIGLLTDDVGQVLELGPGDVEAAPELGAPVSARFLRGVGKVGSRFVLILDAEALIGGDAMREAWKDLGLDAALAEPGHAGEEPATEPDLGVRPAEEA